MWGVSNKTAVNINFHFGKHKSYWMTIINIFE